MTIQEYIRIAINGFPKKELEYYRPFFQNMDCEHCIFNGFACRHPKSEDVCIEYRVEKKHKEFKIIQETI
jgi:hypothetical protein